MSQKNSSKTLGLALLGPRYTNSDIAAENYLKKEKNFRKVFCKNIADVFASVQKNKVKQGIVPYKNSKTGLIPETVMELKRNPVQTIAKFNQKISYVLITFKTVQRKNIELLMSHAQVFEQCQKNLSKLYSKSKQKSYVSTMAAFRAFIRSKKRNCAVILCEESAKKILSEMERKTKHKNLLRVFPEKLQDRVNNQTTFLVFTQLK